ncbi:MAG TPA: hypothetical protein VK518_01915 [Puia sp.]|nr:hypothetical protein [Puia sp.]
MNTRQFTLYLFSLLLVATVQAAPGPLPVGNNSAVVETKTAVNSGTIRFQFGNPGSADHQDSVLIIFDKYNRTGAGVVYQVFATDSTHGITIPAVPAGKYYVTIQCKGLHRDRVEKLITIKAKKHEKLHIELEAAERIAKEKIVIPAYRPGFSDMAILKSK